MPSTGKLSGKLQLTLAGLALLASACVGSVGGDGAPGVGPNQPGNPRPGNPGPGNPGPGNPGPGNPGPGDPPPPAGPGDPGTQVFRRLTRVEYNHTVRDLLGDATNPATGFPADAESYHSGYNRGGSISSVDANRIFEAADKLASTAVTSKLGTLLPCGQPPAADADQARCAQEFVDKFGLRAFRRPLTQVESKALFDLYNQQRTEVKHDFAGAIRVVLTAMLMSPNFLYRWESVPEAIKKEGNFLRFNSYEMASRLSYALYASMPDEGLFAAAAADRLQTPGQLETEVRRMLGDARAKDGLGDFIQQWMDVTDLREMVKGPQHAMLYNAQVADALLNESKEMFAGVLAKDGKLGTLLTAKIGYVDAATARIYQAGGITGNQLREAALNDQRAGILTQAAFLATHAKAAETNPITRGRTVADRVLCKDMPLPPDDIPDPKPPGEGLTTRERFAEHGVNPCAQACHNIIDPLGFSFEHYDAIGAWRTQDAGKPVNAAASVDIDGKAVSFKDATELMGHLAGSTEAANCMAKQLLRWSLRRKETTGDEATLAAIQAAFRGSNGDLRELMVSLAKSKAFTHRQASAGETLLP